ncbi:MAG: type I methionyl aminopeptidase [Candidatus Omnitrophica bacterium]|nr:type I methionyl aminopeptidase [Candidatus Omnitrophota bacterium]
MISLKSKREIQTIREAGEIIKQVLAKVEASIRPGVTTEELDRSAETIIREQGAEPAFKGYRGFPKAACISINEEVVHGIPGPRQIKDKDIVSFDVGVKWKGYFADAARTWAVGDVDEVRLRLIRTTYEALKACLKAYRPGCRIGDLSAAIQEHVESQYFNVIRDYVGHGIGREIHEDPQVPNYGQPGQGPKVEPGLVLAIEPMVTEGHWSVETLENGWTVVTKDRKLASHYEDTIAFMESGYINLTGD